MTRVRADANSIAINNGGDGSVTVNMMNSLSELPSALTPLLAQIVQHYKPAFDPNFLLEKSPKIEEKLSFNNLVYYSDDIRENSEFMSIIEESLAIIDSEEPGAKGIIQWVISKIYKDLKRKILMVNKINPSNKQLVQKCISDNSDYIYQSVIEELCKVDSPGMSCTKETLMAAKELLTCYGFISCMVLEEPINDH